MIDPEKMFDEMKKFGVLMIIGPALILVGYLLTWGVKLLIK
jgi:hypothetical protein